MAFILAGGSPLAKRLPSPALMARRLAATLKAGGEGFAYRYTAQVAGKLDLNDAAQSSPIRLPARTRHPSARPSQAPPPATAPCTTAPTHNPQHHHRIAGGRKHQLTAPAAADVTQRTAEIQRRQLRHPSETRCQRCSPNIFDVIVCTHRRPSQAPPPATAPPATASGPQHAASSRHCRRS